MASYQVIRGSGVQDVLEKGAHHLLEVVQDIFLLHEGHFAVDLGEFRLPVRAEVLVAEAADDLEVAVIAGHHQQLLEGLGALREGVELARIHAGRDHEVAGAFRRGLDQVRGLDLHEALGVQEVADLVGHAVPERERPAERTAAEVQVAVFHPDVVAAVGFVLDGEGRGDGLVQDGDGGHLDLDVAGGHLAVLGLALDDLADRLDHEFTAEGGGGVHQVGGRVGLHDQLGDAVTVPEVDEGHAAQFAGFLDPSGERHALSLVADAEFSASVCTIHIFIFGLTSD